MSVSVSNSSLTQAAGPTPSPTKAQPTEVLQEPAKAPGDSVKLSQAAQVHLYKQQGQSPSQIATIPFLPLGSASLKSASYTECGQCSA